MAHYSISLEQRALFDQYVITILILGNYQQNLCALAIREISPKANHLLPDFQLNFLVTGAYAPATSTLHSILFALQCHALIPALLEPPARPYSS